MDGQTAAKARILARMEVYLGYLDYRLTGAEMMRDENSAAVDEIRSGVEYLENMLESHGLYQKPKPIVESLKSMFDELIGPNRKRPKVVENITRDSASMIDSDKKTSAKFQSPAIDSKNNSTFQTFRGTSSTKNKENLPPSKPNSQPANTQTSDRSKYSSSGSEKMPTLVAATQLPHKRQELLADGLVPIKATPATKPPTMSQADMFKMLGLSSPGDDIQMPALTAHQFDSRHSSGTKESYGSGRMQYSPQNVVHPEEFSKFQEMSAPVRELPPTPGAPLFKQSMTRADTTAQTQDYSQRVEALMSLLLAP